MLQYFNDFELPDRTSELKNKIFLMRMLFKQCGCGNPDVSTVNSNTNLQLCYLTLM